MAAEQVAAESFAEDAIPSLHRIQLLRCLPRAGEEGSNAQVSMTRFVLLAARTADGQRNLAGVLGLTCHRLQQQGPVGDHLTVVVGIGKTDKRAPSVVDQSDAASEQPASLEVLRREAAPVPVVLQLIEGVLDIPYKAPLGRPRIEPHARPAAAANPEPGGGCLAL